MEAREGQEEVVERGGKAREAEEDGEAVAGE